MWLDNLKDLRKQKGNPSYKSIADGTSLPERTIVRIFSGETDHPYMDTIQRIVAYFGGSLDDIFADTKIVVGDENLVKSQEEVVVVSAENDMLSVENKMLKDKVAALQAEVDLLKMKLQHKEEIITLHNYYNKLKTVE